MSTSKTAFSGTGIPIDKHIGTNGTGLSKPHDSHLSIYDLSDSVVDTGVHGVTSDPSDLLSILLFLVDLLL